MDDDPATRFRENVTGITAVVVTGLWLSLLLAGFPASLWLPVLIVGYVVVVPIVAILFGDEEDIREWWDEDELGSSYPADDESVGEEDDGRDRRDAFDRRDALDRLRERYAAGELTDEQFEAKLELLLQTETIEDLEYWKRNRRGDGHERNLDERARDEREPDDRHQTGRSRNERQQDERQQDERQQDERQRDERQRDERQQDERQQDERQRAERQRDRTDRDEEPEYER